jgi:hypothetical protein
MHILRVLNKSSLIISSFSLSSAPSPAKSYGVHGMERTDSAKTLTDREKFSQQEEDATDSALAEGMNSEETETKPGPSTAVSYTHLTLPTNGW